MSRQDPPPGPPRVVRTIGQATPTRPPEPPSVDEGNPLTRILLAVAVLLLVVGIGWSAVVGNRYNVVVGSQSWPNTMGMITDCIEGEDVPNQEKRQTRLKYRYDVNDERYTSTNVSFDDRPTFHCSEYPLGKGVRVYYAPWKPSLATLNPGRDSGSLVAQLAVAVMFILLGVVLAAVQVIFLVRPDWMRATLQQFR